eukprot:gene8865-814_t
MQKEINVEEQKEEIKQEQVKKDLKRKSDDKNDEEESETKKQKLPKKKVVLVIGYNGSNYKGIQINPGQETIEKSVLEACIKIGAISEDNSNDYHKVKWARSSRTDKGVHALINLISLKMLIQKDGLERLNKELPNDIRVYKIQRVTKFFNPKNMCEGRKYEYVIPSFCFNDEFKFNNFKLSKEKEEKIEKYLKHFEGTKNYHNFTKFTDPNKKLEQFKRYITSFKIEKKFELENIEFLSITIIGQSFLFNQIRKMIGFVICLMTKNFEEEEIEKIHDPKYIKFVPRVPGEGLMLSELHFPGYNKQHGDLHGPLIFEGDEFKEKENLKNDIIKDIVRMELKDKIFENYMIELKEIIEKNKE